MLPCCLLLTSAVINFPVNWEYFWVNWDVPLTPLLLCSNSTASSASSFLLSFLCVPLLYTSLSRSLSSSWGVPSQLLQITPIPGSVHHKLLIACTHTLCGEVLPSNAHNNKPVAVKFCACLSCCCVSVLCWCSTAWLLCFLSLLFVATTLCIFPLSKTLPPRGCHHSHACSSFSILILMP